MASKSSYFFFVLFLLFVSNVWASGEYERPGSDYSAYRVDSDIFGWSEDFKEIAAIASETRRSPNGEIRGTAFMLVFKVGQAYPEHNVFLMPITQAAQPIDPLPIKDVRDNMWMIDFRYQNMWPKRPTREHHAGAMLIEPLWEKIVQSDGTCQVAIGFILKYRKQQRYHKHQWVDLKASCSNLKLTDTRTYWGRSDMGVVMMKFDYGELASNEVSTRVPLSTAWSLGEHIEINMANNTPQRSKIEKILSHYGKVKTNMLLQHDLKNSSVYVDYRPGYHFLAYRLAQEIQGQVGQELAQVSSAIQIR